MSGWLSNLPMITPVAFGSLPAAQEGMIAVINDGLAVNCADGSCTTFGTHVTGGGGALQLLIWYNNANWTLIGK